MRKNMIGFAMILMTTLSGCGTYRYVQRDQAGGVIAVRGLRDVAMEKAHSAMAAHCGGHYRIVEEGEVVTGSESYGASRTGVTRRGTVLTVQRTGTRDTTEWRVRYECSPAPERLPAPGIGGAVARVAS